jgi:hypothetical protein
MEREEGDKMKSKGRRGEEDGGVEQVEGSRTWEGEQDK